MNFNIYLDDETGQQLNRAAEQAGESRNALIRRAIGDWLSRHRKPNWPDEVLAFKGIAGMPAIPLKASTSSGQLGLRCRDSQSPIALRISAFRDSPACSAARLSCWPVSSSR